MRRNIFAFLGVAFLSLSLLVASVAAQQGGSGLQVSPTKTPVITANPGEQKTFTVSLKNITEGPMTAKVVLNDFKSDGSSGTPIIIEDSSRTPYTLNNMLKPLEDIQLGPGETKEVKGVIDVPSDAAPGAYFGAVRYVVVPQGSSESERQIALNASVAHLVFVKVPGDIVEQIKVESLKFQSGEKSGKLFINKPDKSMLEIKNMGNGFAEPFGAVTINNMFSKEIANYQVNSAAESPRGMILPNSSRVFTNDFGGVSLPGKYTATASVAYGDGAEVVNYKTSFWYLPIWFIVITVAIFGLIIFGAIRLLRKKNKK